MNLSVPEKLKALRKFLQEHQLNGWIVPTADPHLSEYVDEHYAFRKWLSGFTGSAGMLLVTHDAAALLTDSRYWVQAEQQLKGSGIELLKLNGPYSEEVVDWFSAHLLPNDKVGICPKFISGLEAKKISKAFSAHNLELTFIKEEPEDSVWTDRPPVVSKPVFEHTLSPRKRSYKISVLCEKMHELGADYLLTAKLDEIAWIFNLRGSDVPDNPVFYAYALIEADGKSKLFIDPAKVSDSIRSALKADHTEVLPYEEAGRFLTVLSSGTLIADPHEVNASLLSFIPTGVKVLDLPNPIEKMKALKMPEEIELISEAMLKDGVALVRFYAWLDNNIGKIEMTEGFLAQKLLSFREQDKDFVSLSFETISAFGPNAALPHYQPVKSGAKIEGNGFLLIDSGAQYPQGTTDITRTKLIGKATDEMREDYTAVLRANIRLARAVFPDGLSAQLLDPIAREPIWQHFANFGHGTGHGVGFFLNVHEGPQRISYPRITPQTDAVISKETAMLEGMLTSDEPGIYRAGRWGIRIENLIATEFAEENEFGRFLRFRTLTLCPIDLSPVISERLLPDEKKWLNEYHALVRQKVLPHIHDEVTIVWLMWNTREI